MTLGELIRIRRNELNMTLEDVGKKVGVGKSTVKKWESGYIANMKRDKISLLANALDLPPSAFISENEISIDISKAIKEKLIPNRDEPEERDNKLSEEERLIIYLFGKVDPERRKQLLARIESDLKNQELL